ncbi:hypothetical protein LH612_33460, partial [Klebsiella pneumoniae]|nr:hypothetical protein [Klebsiella pneumoniae]
AAAGISAFGDRAGAHVVVPLADAETEQRVVSRARAEGLVLDGLQRHHCGPQQWFGIALGYASCDRDDLERALPVLARLCTDT